VQDCGPCGTVDRSGLDRTVFNTLESNLWEGREKGR
jgi:hypothetical protein